MSISRKRVANPFAGSELLRKYASEQQLTSRRVWCGLVLSLFLTRFFYVAESADRGETLWIVGCWIVAFMGWSLAAWIDSPVRPSMGWLGVGVGLMLGGQIASALVIVFSTGDRRAAMNLAWEGLGVAIGWFLLHQECRRFEFRRELLAGLIATGTAAAGLGLYQHYLDFPQMAAKYAPLFDRLKQADPIEAASIRKSLAIENIPTDGPSLILFEKRLRDSREPLGFFALANTFSGFLTVCLVLAISIAVSFRRLTNPAGWKQLAPWILIIFLLSWALLLTKSRTAWMGTLAGLVLLSLLSRRARWTGRGLRYLLGFLISILLFGWVLTQFGGLDRQVLSEAPKSLQYRLQYWQATARLISDHLILGVGPGQFRGHYLTYKLPEASEEIADPHNLFLESAASGGVASLFGLIIICVLLFKNLGSGLLAEESPRVSTSQTGTIISGLAAVAWVLLLLDGADDRLLVLLPVSVALFWGLCRALTVFHVEPEMIRFGWQSAAFALVCHLCGAGGIGMPVITLLLLTLIDCGSLPKAENQEMPVDRFLGFLPWWLAVSTGLLIGLIVTGIRPVSEVETKLYSGDRLIAKGLLEAAEIEYKWAEVADGFSSEATKRRAELAYRKAAQEHFRSNESFQNAVNLLNKAKLRNPTSFRDDVRVGEWWIDRWRTSRDPRDAEKAVEALERAWARYPTNAGLMADLAIACYHAGAQERAKDVALQSLRQDAINQEWGHVDRYLEEHKRLQMKSLSEGSGLSS